MRNVNNTFMGFEFIYSKIFHIIKNSATSCIIHILSTYTIMEVHVNED